MPSTDPDLSLRLVRDEGAWLRELARHLARDGGEDALQETWVRALQGGVRREVPGRGWLATVLRNALRQEHRSASRRRDRERAVARPEARPPEVEALERLELRRMVVEAVRELEEPLRTVVALRYLDGLSTRAVAERLGLSTRTVQARLEQGLAGLRRRLDRSCGGDRSRWLGAMVALGRPRPLAAWIGAGAMGAGTKLVLGIVGTGALVGGALLVGGGEAEPAGPAAPAVVSVEAPEARVEQVARTQDRAAVESTHDPVRAASPPPGAATTIVRGRVQDLAGAPVADVPVAILPRGERADARLVAEAARSGPDGSFELPLAGGTLQVVGGAWATLTRVHLVAGEVLPDEDALLVVVPARDYAGTVVDELGAPVADLEVRAFAPTGAVSALQRGRHVHRPALWRTHTDEDGAFAFRGLPWIEGAALSATRPGHEPAHLGLPGHDDLDLVLTLVPLSEADVVPGRVIDAQGAPVVGAWVAAGEVGVATDAAGTFLLPLPAQPLPIEFSSPGEGLVARAVILGRAPAERRLDPEDPPDFLEFVLEHEAATLAGRVLGGDGEPVEGARVWVSDLTWFGSLPEPDLDLQVLVARTVEQLIGGEGSHSRTDAQGAFLLEGLLERAYTLYVLDPTTLARLGPVEVHPGEASVQLVLPTAPRTAVRGRVLDRRGEPVPGARVFATPDLPSPPSLGDGCTTDEQGRFEFAPLELADVRLVVFDPDIPLSTEFELETLGDPTDIELVVGRRCWLRVLAEDPALVEATLSIEDAEGRELSLLRQAGNLMMTGTAFRLQDGRSGPMQVEDRATTLILRAGEREERIPLDLRPGVEREVRVR